MNKTSRVMFALFVVIILSFSYVFAADAVTPLMFNSIDELLGAPATGPNSAKTSANDVTIKIGNSQAPISAANVITKRDQDGVDAISFKSNGLVYFITGNFEDNKFTTTDSDVSKLIPVDKTKYPLAYSDKFTPTIVSLTTANDVTLKMGFTSKQDKNIVLAYDQNDRIYKAFDVDSGLTFNDYFYTEAGLVKLTGTNFVLTMNNGATVNLGSDPAKAIEMVRDKQSLIDAFIAAGLKDEISPENFEKAESEDGFKNIKYGNDYLTTFSSSSDFNTVERKDLRTGIIDRLSGKDVSISSTFDYPVKENQVLSRVIIDEKGSEKTIATATKTSVWTLVTEGGQPTGAYVVGGESPQYRVGKAGEGVYSYTNGNINSNSIPNIITNKDGKPIIDEKAIKSLAPDAQSEARRVANKEIAKINEARDVAKVSITVDMFTTAQSEYEKERKAYADTYKISEKQAGFILKLNDYSKVAQGFSGFSSLFAGNKAIQDWKLAVDKTFRSFTTAGWVESICAKKFKQPAQSTAFVRIPGGSIAPAATIAAECTPVIDSLVGNTTRMYKFTVHVSNPQSMDYYSPPMTFNVRLYGSQEIDLFTEKHTLERGESFTLDKDKQPVLSSELYDKICINFDEPPEFFKGTQVCNKITCRDDLLNSGYESLPSSAEIYVTIQQKQAAQGNASVSAQANITSLLNPGI